MICDYCGREISGEPCIVTMEKHDGESGVGERYFHDEDCYRLFVEDDYEYEAVGLTAEES